MKNNLVLVLCLSSFFGCSSMVTRTQPKTAPAIKSKPAPISTNPPRPSSQPIVTENLKLEPVVIPAPQVDPSNSSSSAASEPKNEFAPVPIEDQTPANPQNIGILLPMTGKSEAISKKTLRSIELGLGISANSPSPFKLFVLDTQDFPEKLESAVDQLVQVKRCIAIVGSITGKDSETIAKRAQELLVPLLNLSQRQNLTDAGPYIFQTSITYSQQTRYIARTAIRDLGLKRFAIIYPNDSFGVELANVFWDEVLASGGFVTAVQTYQPNERDFSTQVKRMTGISFPELRKEELEKAIAEKKKIERKQREADREDLLKPVIAFDAIFIPEQIKVGAQVAAFLAYHGVKSPKILGLSLWNSTSTPKRFSQVSDQILIVDARKSISATNYAEQFTELSSDDIGPFDIQAYETGAMLKSAFQQNPSTRASLRNLLAESTNVPLETGTIGFSQKRELIRDYSLYVLKDGALAPLPVLNQ